jgi:HEAT repeat protein
MRSKTVVMVLLATVGVIALLVAVKALTRSSSEPIGEAAAQASQSTSPEPAPAAQVNPPGGSTIAKTPEQERADRIERDLDEVREAQAAGKDDPASLGKILDRVTNPEPEVRKAAIDAVLHLDDRAAIPLLKEALQKLEDPHDKAAILDAIEFLQAPSVEDAVAAAAATFVPNTNVVKQPK